MVFCWTSEHAIMSWNDEEPFQNCHRLQSAYGSHFPTTFSSYFRPSSQLKCKACNHLFALSVHQGWWLPSKVACYPLQAWACMSLLPPCVLVCKLVTPLRNRPVPQMSASAPMTSSLHHPPPSLLLPHLMTSCYPLRNRPVSDTSRAFKTFTFLGFNVRYAALLVEIPVTCINLEDEHTDDAIWYLVQEDLIPCRCLLLYILSAKVFIEHCSISSRRIPHGWGGVDLTFWK